MTYKVFLQLYNEALDYTDVDMYIAERGWQDWMDDFNENEVAPVLFKIYDIARMDIIALRNLSGDSQAAFARRFDIPIRTLQGWEYGERTAPDYLIKLIAYAIFMQESL